MKRLILIASILLACFSISAQDRNTFAESGQAWLDQCKNTCRSTRLKKNSPTIAKVKPIFKELKHVSVRPGYTCKAKMPKLSNRMGAVFTVYSKAGAVKHDILDGFRFENNEEGIWEMFLVSETWRQLPKFWHACYATRDPFFSLGSLDKVISTDNAGFIGGAKPNEDQIDKLKAANYDPSLLPAVSCDEKGGVITYCYWSPFEGLVQEKVLATIDGNKISFGILSQTVLIEYDCGIMF